MSDCKENSGCCEVNPFSYVVAGAPDDDVIDDIIAELSGLRWELPCTSVPAGVCDCDVETSDSATLVGDPTRTYQVELRFRGFVEPKGYIGGTNNGDFLQIGGTPDGSNFNIYSLEVSSPPQIFYLNRFHSPSFINPGAIDFNAVIPMNGGATVVLRSNSVEGKELANSGSVVVPGVPPDPAAFDGQFLQMDVVEIT